MTIYTSHALDRGSERCIFIEKKLTIDEVKLMPIYTSNNGCIKYLDIKNNIVYYVRGNNIVTMIKTNPIQMLKYYVFGRGDNFNNYCRDNVFGNCKYGYKCKYIHI